jgi:hypothetical protein
MGFRFNKTLKQKTNDLEEFWEHNPSFKPKNQGQGSGLKASFYENNPVAVGTAIMKWKVLALLVAGPFCTWGVYKMLTYTDPVEYDKIIKKEKTMRDKEKEILEA